MHRDEHPESDRRSRPDTQERFAAAAELAASASAALKRHARRYSLCAADAEDAYQRGLEILLTKAPTSERSELRAWLHTVVKHEALALRRQRERSVASGSAESLPAGALAGGGPDPPEDRAGGRERARQAAEALAHLKPAELRCMLLKALGYSYEEIGARTGFTRTKVNRCLAEGRRRFIERFDRVASGAGCEDLRPLLFAAGDGEVDRRDLIRLRAHLHACGSCRAALRGYRSAPARLAELLPPSLLLPALERGGWWARLSDWLGAGAGERAGAVASRVQQGAEALSVKHAAAVMASTAALAGGGVAVQERAVHHDGAARSARQAAGHAATGASAAVVTATAVAQAGARASQVSPAATASRGSDSEERDEFGFESGSGGAPGGRPARAVAASAGSQTTAAPASAPASTRVTGAEPLGGPAVTTTAGRSGGGEFGP